MKKTFRAILKVAMCLFGIVILIIAGFRFEKAINELDDEMFKSYKCYDYHLTALKTTAKRSWILSSDDESKFYSVYARGIKGVPYKKFVRAGCTDGSFFILSMRFTYTFIKIPTIMLMC